MSRPDRQAQARSIATRERLIATTLDTIHELGLSRAATPEFARRAGVSRGALLHHFPTREDIIVAAMESMLEAGIDEIRGVAAGVARDAVEMDALLDFLWELFSGRFFTLSVEFINAARTDPALRAKMLPLVRRFHEALDEIWAENCGTGPIDRSNARLLLNLTLCLFRGMGVQTVLRDDPEYFRTLLETWKTLLPTLARDLTAPALPHPRAASGPS